VRERGVIELDAFVTLFGVLICTWCLVFGVSESTRGRKSKVRGETCDEVSYVVMWHVCELGECGQL
jgi:hypothetical protein